MDIAKIEALVTGREYAFTHQRKGTFRAIFMGVEPAEEGDPQDTHLVRVMVPTGSGSGQEWMANAKVVIAGVKQTPPQSEKLIRPTLLSAIGEIMEG